MEKRLKWLRKQVGRRIRQGKKVVVIGWIGRNHNALTRFLSEQGLVKFIAGDDLRRDALNSDCLVLSTRFRGHVVPGGGPGGSQWPVLNIGQIKSLLGPIAEKLVSAARAARKKEKEEMQKILTPPAPLPAAQGAGQDREPTQAEKETNFAAAFVAACHHEPDGKLSRNKANDLLRKHFGPKTRASAFRHLIQGVIREGTKKVGSYKPTERLLEIATHPDLEPSDPVDRARWLVGREPQIKKRLEDLKKEIEGLEKQLQKVERAKNLLSQLEKL